MPTPDEVLAYAVQLQRQLVAGERRRCRMANAHRWWPVGGPGDVTDAPMLAVCLHCTMLRPLREVLR